MNTHIPNSGLASDSLAKSWCGLWLRYDHFAVDEPTCADCVLVRDFELGL